MFEYEKKSISMRFSVFFKSFLNFSPQLGEKILEIFNDQKSIITIIPAPLNVIGDFNHIDWMILPVEKGIQVCFSDNKIDFIMASNENLITSDDFTGALLDKFFALRSFFKGEAIRIAFAKKYMIPSELSSKFLSKNLQKRNFGDTTITDASFSETFVRDEEINGNSLKMNYLLTCNSDVQIPSQTLSVDERKSLIFSTDINTSVNNQKIFSNEDIEDFLNKVAIFNKKICDYFFEGL